MSPPLDPETLSLIGFKKLTTKLLSGNTSHTVSLRSAWEAFLVQVRPAGAEGSALGGQVFRVTLWGIPPKEHRPAPRLAQPDLVLLHVDNHGQYTAVMRKRAGGTVQSHLIDLPELSPMELLVRAAAVAEAEEAAATG